MDNFEKLKKFVSLMEKNNTYFYIHGGDVLISFITIIIVILGFTFLSLKKKQVYYKKNWPKYKCDPSITPFAGFLNPPPNSNFKDKMTYTMRNYAMCNMDVLQSNFGLFTRPLRFAQSMLGIVILLITNAMEAIRVIFQNLQNTVFKLFNLIFGKFANIIIALQMWMVNLKDTLSKIAGTMVSIYMFGISLFFTASTVFQNIIASTIIALIIISVVTAFFLILIPTGFGLVPFLTWALAYAAVATPFVLTIIIHELVRTRLACENDPESCCFHSDTIVNTKRGPVKMKDIVVGEDLGNGNKVYSTMKIKAKEPLYILNDVLVTGNHYFYCKQRGFIKVKDSPNASLTDLDEQYYYCLITSKKDIIINNIKFCDWDDLDSTDIIKLKNVYNITNVEDFNDAFNSNLHPDSVVYTNSHMKNIQNILVGDILLDGSFVTSIIKSRKPKTIYKYHINNTTIIGSNVHFKNIETFKIMKKELYLDVDNDYYYNLITNTGVLNIDNIDITDHNRVFDNIVDNVKKC